MVENSNIGLELINILSKHSKAKILYLCASKSIGKKINNFDERLGNKNFPRISKLDNVDWKEINILYSSQY